MTPYDPKQLEQFYRFMAEASRSQARSQELMAALAEVASPEAWAKVFGAVLPGQVPPSPESPLQIWTESYWAAFGFVPKARYDALERQYVELKGKLEQAEREAARARRLAAQQGQEEQAKQALEAWSETVSQTLQAQQQWWAAWFGQPQEPDA